MLLLVIEVEFVVFALGMRIILETELGLITSYSTHGSGLPHHSFLGFGQLPHLLTVPFGSGLLSIIGANLDRVRRVVVKGVPLSRRLSTT